MKRKGVFISLLLAVVLAGSVTLAQSKDGVRKGCMVGGMKMKMGIQTIGKMGMDGWAMPEKEVAMKEMTDRCPMRERSQRMMGEMEEQVDNEMERTK